MSHIFISYSKKNYQYAHDLADFLIAKGFNVWIDKIGIEYGVNWWDAIVKGLKGCGALVVVMTPEAKESPWVQREVFLVLDKKPVFPLLLNGDNWEVFALTQFADVSDFSYPDDDFLERLSHHVTPQRRAENKSSLTPEAQSTNPPPPENLFDLDATIAECLRAFRANNWQLALEHLGQIRASGEDPHPFDPDDVERKIQQAVEAENKRREQERFEAERAKQYNRLAVMAEHGDPDIVWTGLQKFWVTFPNFDPQNLRRFKPAPPPAIKPLPAQQQKQTPRPSPLEDSGLGRVAAPPLPISEVSDVEILRQWNEATHKILGGDSASIFQKLLGSHVQFEWCPIPAGKVVIEDGIGEQTVQPFWLAKYSITYVQFQVFLDDPQGFKNPQWWEHLAANADHKKQWGDQQWKIANHPRENVSWYDAMAFCRWLSFKLWQTSVGTYSYAPLPQSGYNALDPNTWLIRLPTEAEWQRTAQGDDRREYPWGNNFDQTRCNTSESGIRKTTPVLQYPQGASPYRVLDMSGNVCEWCLTEYDNGDNRNITNRNQRILRGGSWYGESNSARSVYRDFYDPDDRDSDLGFRVLLQIPPFLEP